MKRSRKKKTIGDFIWRLVFLAALVVFCYCAFQLVTIYLEYKKGTDEYSSLEQQYVTEDTISGTTENNTPSGTGDGTRTGSDGSEATDGTSETTGKVEGSGTAEDPYTTGETETEIETDAEGKTTVKAYPVLKNPVDFESLKKVNEDIIGWIRVNALDISYPIAQSTDNDYYLHRTFERVDNFAGCIFMEYQNHSDFSDKHTFGQEENAAGTLFVDSNITDGMDARHVIIYGHNMKNGSMFGTLRKFYEDEVYEKAPYFWIYTPDKIYRYDIFSCAEVAVDSLAYQITFSEEGSFEKYIDDAYSRSVVKGNDIKVTAEDKIVTLSTCTGNESTRFIVQGKLSKTYWSKKK